MRYKLWAAALLLWTSPSSATNSVDEALYSVFHDLYRASWLERAMGEVTRLGDVRFQLALCAGMAAYGRDYDRDSARLHLTALSGSGAVVYMLKRLVDRPRPERPKSKDSFPSGHSAAVWACASIFAHRYPKYRWAYCAAASLVSFSRVYLGKHYPSDVLFGAAIGYGVAELVWHYRDRIRELRLR